MAEKIDYKEYLKSLGKIETDAKKRIQAYLEEQIKEDAALRELYRAEKIDDCYDFIKNAVKATGCGSSATVEDTGNRRRKASGQRKLRNSMRGSSSRKRKTGNRSHAPSGMQ